MEHHVASAVGLLIGLAVAGIIVTLLFQKRVLDMTFDERQERARGRAYQYGFWTLVGAVLAYGFTEMALGRWCDALAGSTLCLGAGLLVFAAICITKDAYLSLREKPRQIVILLVAVSALNLGLGGAYLAEGSLVEDGVLTYRASNPILGLMVLVILAIYVVHGLRRRGDGE